MRASAHRLHFESGGCAAAPFFLLLAQKKEGKEKGTLLTRPAAALRVLSLTGARQLAAAQTRLASDLSGTAMLDALEGNNPGLFNLICRSPRLPRIMPFFTKRLNQLPSQRQLE
jgi:hypothetical protein